MAQDHGMVTWKVDPRTKVSARCEIITGEFKGREAFITGRRMGTFGVQVLLALASHKKGRCLMRSREYTDVKVLETYTTAKYLRDLI